ncbi:hypothetical protein [Curtobacterium sp. NPDC089689]|uniref:hypothetical protein n=1 Tax=Curtobacterium sp. NPDC089689 TaxID=3363968 RepID=UPI0037F6E577
MEVSTETDEQRARAIGHGDQQALARAFDRYAAMLLCTVTPGSDSGAAIAGTLFTRGDLTVAIEQADFPIRGD